MTLNLHMEGDGITIHEDATNKERLLDYIIETKNKYNLNENIWLEIVDKERIVKIDLYKASGGTSSSDSIIYSSKLLLFSTILFMYSTLSSLNFFNILLYFD